MLIMLISVILKAFSKRSSFCLKQVFLYDTGNGKYTIVLIQWRIYLFDIWFLYIILLYSLIIIFKKIKLYQLKFMQIIKAKILLKVCCYSFYFISSLHYFSLLVWFFFCIGVYSINKFASWVKFQNFFIFSFY